MRKDFKQAISDAEFGIRLNPKYAAPSRSRSRRVPPHRTTLTRPIAFPFHPRVRPCACRRWAKLYSRKAVAHFYLKEFDESVTAYEHAVRLDPGQSDYAAGLARARAECQSIDHVKRKEAERRRLARFAAPPGGSQRGPGGGARRLRGPGRPKHSSARRGRASRRDTNATSRPTARPAARPLQLGGFRRDWRGKSQRRTEGGAFGSTSLGICGAGARRQGARRGSATSMRLQTHGATWRRSIARGAATRTASTRTAASIRWPSRKPRDGGPARAVRWKTSLGSTEPSEGARGRGASDFEGDHWIAACECHSLLIDTRLHETVTIPQ